MKFSLDDVQKLRRECKDKNISLFDYMFITMQIKKLSTDLYFAFRELFWPSFKVHKNRVFLKEEFNIKEFNRMEKKGENVELWLNIFLVEAFFENDDMQIEKARSFAKSLVKIWSLKLKNDFPDKEFVVKYINDEEAGDFGLTFYQKKYSFPVSSKNF